MTFSSFLTRATAALALTLSVSAALAVPVTFSFIAEIETAELVQYGTGGVTRTPNFAMLPGEGTGVGDIFSGTFTFDTDAPFHTGIPSTPGVDQWYRDAGLDQGIELRNQDGSVVLSSNGIYSWFGTSINVDKSSFFLAPPPVNNGAADVYIFFSDWSHQSFQDLQIPSELDLENYNTARFNLILNRDSSWVELRGNVTGLSAVQASEVPEPASIFIFTLALAAAGAFAWRKMPR